MTYQRRIGMFDVIVDCDEDYAQQAEGLLSKLAELDARGPALRDGSTIQLGWSRLTLRAQDGALWVYEPGFDTEDPDANPSTGAHWTLKVLSKQVALLNTLGISGEDIHYLDKVVAVRGALDSVHTYMHRQPESAPGDSGWLIGDVDAPERGKVEENLESMPVYRLVEHPFLMAALTLPRGYLVTFLGTMIENVRDADNKVVYSLS